MKTKAVEGMYAKKWPVLEFWNLDEKEDKPEFRIGLRKAEMIADHIPELKEFAKRARWKCKQKTQERLK